MSIDIDPAQLESWLNRFASFGAHGATGVWRTVYSPEWIAAAEQYEAWARGAGLTVRRDAVGNIWARLEGRDGGGSIVTGSHIDTVTPGGRYDGALGTLGGLVAVTTLMRQYGQPRCTIEAVALCEEESSRFRANFWGSRAVIGRIALGDPDQIIGFDGMTIAEAMRQVGLDPARCGEARRQDVAAFIELHIEQGPTLESANRPVGIVTGITAIRGVQVEVSGTANHAGAFPMAGRRDPVEGFAEIASAVIGCARDMGAPAVTTIGRVEVDPNLSTAIAGRVRFTIDTRHPDTGICQHLCDEQDAVMKDIAAQRGLGLSQTVTSQHAACQSDGALVEALQVSAREAGIQSLDMVSGAAHDAQQMAKIAPVAMVFVRSRDGRSHTPEEFSSLDDMADGVRVLASALHRLAY